MNQKPTYEELEQKIKSLEAEIEKSKHLKQSDVTKSESLFRGLFDNMTSGSAIYEVINDGSKGTDYIIRGFNNKSLEIEGKTLDQVMGKSLADLRPNIDDYGLISIFKEVWETGISKYFPVKIYQDEKFSNYYENYVFKIPSGEVVTIYNDVTEQKNVEMALKQSKERFELAMLFANDGLFDWNLTTNQIYYSSGWKKILGYEDNEIKNEFSEWERLTKKEDVASSWELLNELIAGKRDRFEKEFKMQHKNGHWVDILSRANIVRDENGEVVRVVGTHIDITSRKQKEKNLKLEKEKFLSTLDEIPAFVYLQAPDYTIRYGNKMFRNLFGNYQNKLCYQIIQKNNQPCKVCPTFDVFKTQKTQSWEWKRNDDEIYLITDNYFVDFDGTPLVLEMGIDITQSKNAEKIKKMLDEQLLQSQKIEAIGTLAGGIAHDFNNMIGVISGNISYALSLLDKKDELFEILSDVQDSAKQAKSLTQQLLTFSKGGAPIKKVADVNQLIRESASLVTRGEKSKCNFFLENDLWPVVVDHGQINQAVNNLVINSCQAMPCGGTIRIQTENKIINKTSQYPLSPGKYVKISIKDEGSGILDKYLQNIFDPYFSTKQKGSGLGLATTYSIIKRHDGHISVNSTLGEGTLFCIYLPAREGGIIAKAEKNEIYEHTSSGKVLIMDDDESILKMSGRILQRIGYEADFARDGLQAVNMYEKALLTEKPYKLVILDLTIPGGMGGAITISKLLKVDPSVKAVVSSGYSNDPIMANYKDYGFCGVVPKPYTQNQIAKVLKKCI